MKNENVFKRMIRLIRDNVGYFILSVFLALFVFIVLTV